MESKFWSVIRRYIYKNILREKKKKIINCWEKKKGDFGVYWLKIIKSCVATAALHQFINTCMDQAAAKKDKRTIWINKQFYINITFLKKCNKGKKKK